MAVYWLLLQLCVYAYTQYVILHHFHLLHCIHYAWPIQTTTFPYQYHPLIIESPVSPLVLLTYNTLCIVPNVTTQRRLCCACWESSVAHRGARTTSVALISKKKILFELTTTLYVLYASCTTCAIDLRFPERRSEVQQSKGLSIDSSLARIDT